MAALISIGILKLIKSIVLLLSGSLVSSLLTFLTHAILARNLSAAEFGTLISNINIALMLAPLVALGGDVYFLKKVCSENVESKELNVSWLSYFLISSIISVSIYCFISDEKLWFLFSIVFSQSILNYTVAQYQSLLQYNKVSLLLLMQSLIRVLLVLIMLYFDSFNFYNASFVYFFVSIFVIFTCSYLLYGNFPKVFSINFFEVFRFAKNAAPFGFTGLLHLFYFQSSIVIVNKVDQVASGLYAVAFSLITAAFILPSVIYQKYFLPKIHIISNADNVEMQEKEIFFKGFTAMFILGGVGALSFYFLSDLLVIKLFGEDYIGAVQFVKILSACVFFRYVSSNLGVFLISKELVVKKNYIMLVCCSLSVITTSYVVINYNAIYSAYIFVCAEALLMVLFFICVFKEKTYIFKKDS